jgi:hypothetical protein
MITLSFLNSGSETEEKGCPMACLLESQACSDKFEVLAISVSKGIGFAVTAIGKSVARQKS